MTCGENVMRVLHSEDMRNFYGSYYSLGSNIGIIRIFGRRCKILLQGVISQGIAIDEQEHSSRPVSNPLFGRKLTATALRSGDRVLEQRDELQWADRWKVICADGVADGIWRTTDFTFATAGPGSSPSHDSLCRRHSAPSGFSENDV